jgi:hypothetical protein
MAFINDNVFDSGLGWAQTNGTRIDLCSTDPGGVYATVSGNTLGNDTVSVGSPANHAPDGRKVVVPAIVAGDVTGTGTATHWALTNGSNTVVASGALVAQQVVTSGNTFTLDAIDIALRDAVAV